MTAQQVHGHRSANLFERFKVPHYVSERIQRLGGSKVHFVVDSAELVSHLFSGDQIGRTLDPNRERVHGFIASIRVRRILTLSHGNGSDQGRVETARQEHGVRHIRHQALCHGIHNSFANLRQIRRLCRQIILIHDPLRVVPTRHRRRVVTLLDENVSRREDFIARHPWVVVKRLHFATKPNAPILTRRHVHRNLPHMISRRNNRIVLTVLNHKRKHTIELLDKLRPVLLVQVPDDLTIALIRTHNVKLISQLLVVIDLTIRNKRNILRRIRKQRLVPALTRRDDRQALVHHEGLSPARILSHLHPVRIRSAMA